MRSVGHQHHCVWNSGAAVSSWKAPAPPRSTSLSLVGEGFGSLVLLVVPPYTNPTRAYTAVMTASSPDDVSTPDELLGIGPREAEDRRLALLAQRRWESEGGALRRLGHEHGNGYVLGEIQEVRRAQ